MRAEARIAVVRALHGLGDMLCAVPALSALRAAHPRAQISLIGLPCCKWLLERFGNVIDALVPFPGYPGIPEHPYSPNGLASFLEDMHARPFDLAIQMHGSGGVSNAFTALLGAKTTAGLFEPGRRRPEHGRFFPYPDHGPEVDRWLYLTDMLDCPASDKTTAFPLSEFDRAALNDHALLGGLTSTRYVCIHAGARDPLRRWQADRFARVGDEMLARGYEVVLTGTAAERETANAVAFRMRGDAINAAGETTLGTIAALLERAALLVTNDTGVSHLAASLRTPSVVVFLASDPERWAPVDRTLHRPVLARDLIPQPIDSMRKSRTAIPEADEVLDEAFALLTGGAA